VAASHGTDERGVGAIFPWSMICLNYGDHMLRLELQVVSTLASSLLRVSRLQFSLGNELAGVM
jgi:hypothetical protein